MPWQRPKIGGRMNRDVQVRFCENLEVKVLWATGRRGLTDRVTALS